MLKLMKLYRLRTTLVLFFLPFVLFSLTSPVRCTTTNENITISLPAPVILSSLKEVLPIEFQPQNKAIDGTLIIRSINSLHIKKNMMHVAGVIEGQNLSLVSKIADQDIRIKLGKVTLPITCVLQTRFDKASKILYARPSFQSQNSNSLKPLFNALEKKEYQIPMQDLQLLDINLGATKLPLKVSTVDVLGKNNVLILELEPSLEKQQQ
jgi:hypothetical protein